VERKCKSHPDEHHLADVHKAAEPTYSPAADIVSDTAASPTPSKWASGLEEVLLPANSTLGSTATATTAATAGVNKQNNTAVIAGVAAAGILTVAGLGLGVFLFLRRRRGRQQRGLESPSSPQFYKPELAAERDSRAMDGMGMNTGGIRSIHWESVTVPPQELEAPLPMQPPAELKGSEAVRWS
jgi:hypothetical protein